MTPLTQCPSCKTKMRPEVLDPKGVGITESMTSRVECTHCGHILGRLEWLLA